MFKLYNQISALGRFSNGFCTGHIDSVDSMQASVIGQGYAFTSPQKPNYWMGNGIALFEPAQDVGSQPLIALWDKHIALQMPDALKKGMYWESNKFIDYQNFEEKDNPQTEIILKYAPTKTPISRSTFNIKKVTRDHIQQMVDIYVHQNGEAKREFTGWLTENRMQATEVGNCQFFAIWNEGENEIAAIAGVFWCNGIYRYASVNTRKAHRGRGYCSALIAYIRDFALNNDAKEIYIVTDTGNKATNIYKNAGFEISSYAYSILVDR